MAKGGGWGQYGYSDPTNLGNLLSSILHLANSQGKGWGGKGGGGVSGGGPAKGKGKSKGTKGQGKGPGDWYKRDGTDSRRPEWLCEGCGAENRMGRIACRICWAPRPKCFGRSPNEGGMQQNSAVGADGRKPLLGVRGDNWRSTGGKGTSRATTAAGSTSKGPSGTQLPRGGGAEGGRGQCDKDGYTVVDYKAGNKPRVQPSGHEGGRESEGDADAAKGQGAAPARGDQGSQHQSTKGGTRKEWYDIEDGPEVLYEEWIGDDDEEYDEHVGGEAEEPEGPTELEQANELVQIKREMYTGLRDGKGKGHATTKKAWEELQEAQEWLRQAKGPKPWWQEVTRLQRQKSTAERNRAKVGDKMEQEKEWYQEVTNGHEERMEGLQEKYDDWGAKIKGLEIKIEEARKKPEEEEVDAETNAGNGQRGAASDKMRDIADHLTKALETIEGNEKARGALGRLKTQLGELEGLLKSAPTKERGGQGAANTPTQQQRDWPKLDDRTTSTSGKGVKPGEGNGDAKGGGKGPPADIDRNDQSAQHKWARRSTRRGRDEDEAQVGMGRTSGGDEMEVVEGGTQRDEAGSGAADAASWEKKRQMVLDKIKGRLQQEKNRKATELQAKAIAEGAMPEPHMLTKEQMDECQRRMEATNREVDEEAEKELAAMSKEQISKLVEG